MPQKHNPVDAISAIAAARLAIGEVPVLLAAMAQEHERSAGAWQAEWVAIPNLFRFTAGAVDRVRGAISGLQVDAGQMRANLDLTGGLLMAEALTMTLAQPVGRPQAYQMVQAACKQAIGSKKDLQQAAQEDVRIRTILSQEEIAHALDPACYLGSTDALIDRILENYQRFL